MLISFYLNQKDMPTVDAFQDRRLIPQIKLHEYSKKVTLIAMKYNFSPEQLEAHLSCIKK